MPDRRARGPVPTSRPDESVLWSLYISGGDMLMYPILSHADDGRIYIARKIILTHVSDVHMYMCLLFPEPRHRLN